MRTATAAGQSRPEQALLEKFTQKGFEKLSLEELALTQVSAAWREEFEKATGENWDVYQSKAAERLKRANFDMKWLTKRTDNAHTPLLTAVIRGDASRVNEYMRLYDLRTCIEAVDDTRKTCLHLAAKEGHVELVTLFLSKGWAVDAKDRLNNTPLHLACYRGHGTVVQILLRKNADPMLGDTAGRKAIHYACSALGPEALLALVSHNRAVLTCTDNTGRGAAHYLIHNTSPNCSELLRALLSAGGSVDLRDSEGKTALHYACEAGRGKWVGMLLRSGAGLNVRDNAGKTPVDLAKSDQVHQLISSYLHPPAPSSPLPQVRSLTPPNPSSRPTGISRQRQSRRDLLYSLLRRIQEAGVTGKQHVKNPVLFTGAWVDGISTPQGLLSELSNLSAAETALRVFNVMFPYSKEMPVDEGDEGGAMGFYGEIWSAPPEVIMIDPGEPVPSAAPVEEAGYSRSGPQGNDERTKELQLRVAELEKEGFRLKKELGLAERKVAALEKMVPLGDQLKTMEGERDQAFLIKEKLQREVISLRQQVETLKNSLSACESQLKTAPTADQIQSLQRTLAEKEAKDKALRIKSGLLFLKSLDQRGDEKPAMGEAQLQDGQVIKRLTEALSTEKQDLSELLSSVDTNADGRITKSELTKAMDKLELTPQDILALLRIAGFRPGVNAVGVAGVVRVVEGWEKKRENMVARLFTKLKGKFQGKPLEDIFKALDINGDGTISFTEFGEAVNMLKLEFSREDRHAVFTVLDQDHTGTISLEDMKAEIAKAKDAPPTPLPEEPASDQEPSSPSQPPPRSPTPIKQTSIKPKQASIKPKQTLTAMKGTGKVKGRLYVQFQKGKNLGQGKLYAVGKLAGAEGEVRTGVLEGPMPAWKTKGRFKIDGEVEENVIVDICNLNITLSSCTIPWRSTLSQPHSWSINSDFLVKDKTGKDRGYVTVQMKWVPADSWKLQVNGRLIIQPLRITGGKAVMVTVGVGKATIYTSKPGPPWSEALNLYPLSLAIPLPSLSVQLLDFATQRLLASAACSLEPVLSSAKPEGEEVKVDMGAGISAVLRIAWKAMSDEELLKHKYATKIQAIWRGHKARSSLPKPSPPRRLLSRTGLSANGKYYLLDVFQPEEDDEKPIAELHPASDPHNPLYTVLDTKEVGSPEEVGVSAGGKIVISAGSAVKPVISKLDNVKIPKVENRKEKPEAASKELSGEDLLRQGCATKIQAMWRGHQVRDSLPKSPRKLISRQGLSCNGNYYLLDVYEGEKEGGAVAELHPASDPHQPMYSVLDTKVVSDPQAVKLSSTGKIVGTAVPNIPDNPKTADPKAANNSAQSPSISAGTGGDLGIRILEAQGVKAVMLKCVVGKAFGYSLEGPPWGRPVPVMGVKGETRVEIGVVDVGTRKEVARGVGDFGICLSSPSTWSAPVSIPLTPSGSLSLQYQWQPYPMAKTTEEDAVSKVQAIWKGKQSREEVAITKKQTREVIERRGIQSTDGKYYLISLLKEAGGQHVAELHPIGDPRLPLYTVLDSQPYDPSLSFEDFTVNQGKLHTGREGKAVETAPKPITTGEKGDLAVKIASAKGLENAMLRIVAGTAFVHSLAGPPWPRPMLLTGAVLQANQVSCDIAVVAVADRKELFVQAIQATIGGIGSWTQPVTLRFAENVLLAVQYQWMPYPASQANEEAAAIKVQSAWRGQSARKQVSSAHSHREVLSRTGLTGPDGHIYLISYYKEGEGKVGVGLNRVEQPGSAMYEEKDYIQAEGEVEEVQARVEVTAEGKIRLK